MHSRRLTLIPALTALTATACLGLQTGSAAAADSCSTPSATDVNGDGYDDAVVGDPYATVAGRAGAGVVVVLYGDSDGRIGEGAATVLSQATVPGSRAESGDHFGWSVSVEDATGDGCADILVGSPGEDWSGAADAGIAHLISFTPDGRGGPGTPRSVVFDQGDVAGAVEPGDQFGYAVAVSGSSAADEAIGAVGAPGEDLRGLSDAGVVNTFSYQDAPFQAEQREQGRQGVAWLPGIAEAGDRFGAAVLIAPLEVTDGTGFGIEPSIVAGAPGDTVPTNSGRLDNAGSVIAWDRVTGYQQMVTQDTAGVPGAAEEGDQFGHSLAFSEPSLGESANRGIAVGAPREDVRSVVDAGSVTLLASVEGAGLKGVRAITQDTAGFDGTAEAGDRFGHSVAMTATTRASSLLVIATPYENVGSVADAGMAQTATVSLAAGTVAPLRSYTESSTGTPGSVARNNRFGLTVSAIAGVHEAVFTVSSPYQGAGSVFVVDQNNRPRSWVPGSRGLPTLTGGRFGWAVSGLGSE